MKKGLATELLILVCCIAILSAAAHIFTVFPFDLAVSHEIRGITNPVFVGTMQDASIPGNGWIPLVLVGAITIFLVIRRLYLMAYFVLLTTVSAIVALLLKLVVGRPRPPTFMPEPGGFLFFADRYSFPSGHVLFYTVFFGFIAYLSFHHIKDPGKWLIIVPCTALILLIAPSRIFLGAHWASDVIGSYITGGLLLLILIVGYRTIACRGTK